MSVTSCDCDAIILNFYVTSGMTVQALLKSMNGAAAILTKPRCAETTSKQLTITNHAQIHRHHITCILFERSS